ncbi:MAG: family 10 glycosylhydrolase [Clostridia bacterium]|nr:family 10 glycosylhydrolase [Clostridia bacterium]
MKKALAVLIMLLLLVGCNKKAEEKKQKHSGVWLSYSEVNTMLDGDFKARLQSLIKNCQDLEINNLYIHVRAFGDSLYKSSVFPQNEQATKYDFDVLEYVITACHQNNIAVHAWINPYRISTATQNIEEINPDSPAYLWLHDQDAENDKNVCFSNGIYLNPAETEVQQLIISGVREIVANYDVDGIHFDDYFYPTQSETFDKASYEGYLNENPSPLDLASWRRLNVDLLLSGTYNAIKYLKRDVVFSISPAASVENNFQSLYADVRLWVDNGFVDVIIPQLYFGFDYPDDSFKFEKLLKTWQDISDVNPDVKLYIGLAFYKSKPTLSADIPEWQQNGDIIKRQVELLDGSDKVSGYVYFSYSSLTSSEAEFKSQRDSLTEYLKKRD